MTDSDLHAEITELMKKLTDEGKLIEAGWLSLRLSGIPATAPPTQLREMRKAFFAGALHLLGSLCNVFDPEADVTDADMQRMELIQSELIAFAGELAPD